MASKLELGAQIPAWHWNYSAGELRDWVQGVEALGFDWLAMTDHVLYTYPLPERPTAGRYMGGTFQHETLTTLAYLAACTSRVVLQSAVLVLPQREPVLVAKQAAEIDLLSEGRFRLGVGLGWQEAEFAALGARFGQRPSRFEEAIGVLRACWSEEPVTFAGRYTTLEGMSMVPKPATPGGPRIMVGDRRRRRWSERRGSGMAGSVSRTRGRNGRRQSTRGCGPGSQRRGGTRSRSWCSGRRLWWTIWRRWGRRCGAIGTAGRKGSGYRCRASMRSRGSAWMRMCRSWRRCRARSGRAWCPSSGVSQRSWRCRFKCRPSTTLC